LFKEGQKSGERGEGYTMRTKPFKIPTKKEFRDNPKYNGSCWDDVFGKASCEGCGIFFKPGEMINVSGNGKGYHKNCIPKEQPVNNE